MVKEELKAFLLPFCNVLLLCWGRPKIKYIIFPVKIQWPIITFACLTRKVNMNSHLHLGDSHECIPPFHFLQILFLNYFKKEKKMLLFHNNNKILFFNWASEPDLCMTYVGHKFRAHGKTRTTQWDTSYEETWRNHLWASKCVLDVNSIICFPS